MNPLNLGSIPVWATSLRTSLARPSQETPEEQPAKSEDEGSTATSAASSTHASDPEPARIVSDISNGAHPRAFLTPDPRASRDISASDRLPSGPATTAGRHVSEKEGSASGQLPTKHSFAHSSRMKALQSRWEQASHKESLGGHSASSAIARELSRVPVSSESEAPKSTETSTHEPQNPELIIDASGRAQISNASGVASMHKRRRSDEQSLESNKRRVLPGSSEEDSDSQPTRSPSRLKRHNLVGKLPGRSPSSSKGGARSPSVRDDSVASSSLVSDDDQEGSAGPGGSEKEEPSAFAPISGEQQADSFDSDGSDSDVSDIENENIRPAGDKRSTSDWQTPLTRAVDGRLYSQWRDLDGIVKPTCGGVLPSNYTTRDDVDCPYICPVRDCRVLLTSLQGLGGHMNAKHPRKMFNDNLDGTMTFLGDYKNPTTFSPPIITSRNPPGPNDPAPVQPSMSVRIRKEVEMRRANRQQKGTSLLQRPSRNGPQTDLDFPPSEEDRASTSRALLRRTSSYKAGDPEPSSPLGYLRNRLGRDIQMPETDFANGLLDLPRQRDLPTSCLSKKRLLDNLSGTVLQALLLYITGDAAKKCAFCRESPDALGECVLWPEEAPQTRQSASCGCASCWLESTLYHRRNNCSYVGDISSRLSAPQQKAQLLHNGASYSSPNQRASITVATSDQETPVHNVKLSGPAKRKSAAHSVESSNSGLLSNGLSAINAMPSDILEMEDWEIAPGRLRDESASAPENIAFSNSFLSSNQAIRISGDVSFNVITVKPGSTTHWEKEKGKMRVCSVATGKLRVKMDDTEFVIGPNGMFKIRPGTKYPRALYLATQNVGERVLFLLDVTPPKTSRQHHHDPSKVAMESSSSVIARRPLFRPDRQIRLTDGSEEGYVLDEVIVESRSTNVRMVWRMRDEKAMFCKIVKIPQFLDRGAIMQWMKNLEKNTSTRYLEALMYEDIAWDPKSQWMYLYNECFQSDLGTMINAFAATENNISPVVLRLMVHQTVLGLAACHKAGIVHGNIKPSSVLLSIPYTLELNKAVDQIFAGHTVDVSHDDDVREGLMDIAHFMVDQPCDKYQALCLLSDLDIHHLGTPPDALFRQKHPFIAPEHLDPIAPRSLTFASDVYCLGLVALALLKLDVPEPNERNFLSTSALYPVPEIIEKCMGLVPSSRPSAPDLAEFSDESMYVVHFHPRHIAFMKALFAAPGQLVLDAAARPQTIGHPLGLWTAVQNEDVERIRRLISRNLYHDDNHQVVSMSTHWAVAKGNIPILRMLLDHGLNIESEDSYGRRPLQVAAQAGKWESLRYLAYRGANLNSSYWNPILEDITTPVKTAALLSRSREILDWLLNAGAEPFGLSSEYDPREKRLWWREIADEDLSVLLKEAQQGSC